MALTTPSSAHTTFPHFMDLSPELRLMVYEFALATPEILSFEHEDYRIRSGISAWSLSIFQGVALLRSSWKIYNEALPVLYAVNHFHFDLSANWEYSKRSTDLSNHIAMIRHIGIGAWFDEPWFSDDDCASRLNELLDMFPRLHSFYFFILRPDRRMPCPPLNENAEVLRDLRQRIKSMTIFVSLDDEKNLQGLRDAIAPHDEWLQQTGEAWYSCSIGPSVQAGVRDTNQPGCRIEEL